MPQMNPMNWIIIVSGSYGYLMAASTLIFFLMIKNTINITDTSTPKTSKNTPLKW